MWEVDGLSEENKAMVRRYLEAIDNNEAGNWDVLDEFLAPDFVSHGGLPPGFNPDREGMKQAAELGRRATPGRHVIVDQISEGDRVVTRIRGYGKHTGDFPGVAASGNDVEIEGVAIHRIQDGKITEHWALVDMATFLQQTGVLPSPDG
jgi:predicted ester cyclase